MRIAWALAALALCSGCSLHAGAGAVSLGVDILRAEQRTQVDSGGEQGTTIVREGAAMIRGVELLKAAPAGFWGLVSGLADSVLPAGAPVPTDAQEWLYLAATDVELEARLMRMLAAYEAAGGLE